MIGLQNSSQKDTLIPRFLLDLKSKKDLKLVIRPLTFNTKYLYVCLFIQCTREFPRLYIDSCL